MASGDLTGNSRPSHSERKLALLKNWKLKLGSLLISLFLFWYVQYSKTTTRVLNIRVEKPELPPALVMSSRIPAFMSVKISGPREMMDFNLSEFRILLSNPRPEAGANIYRTMLYPELPEGISAFYDRDISVILDRVLERELPVETVLNLELPANLKPGYVWTRPLTLSVMGPQRVVSEMDRVRTEPLNVSGSVSSFSSKVLITHLPDFVQLAPRQPFEVEVNMHIRPVDFQQDEGTILLEDIPVRCSNDIRGLKLSEEPSVDVLVRYDTEKPQITKEQLQAQVFCPVFISVENERWEIKPTAFIPSLPVRVVDRLKRKEIEILDVTPALIPMKFEKAVVKTPSEIRQGFKEHLIR